jgi:hypothetical protein
MSTPAQRHKENTEAKQRAKEKWEQESKEAGIQEVKKRNSRAFTDKNIAAYRGPETDRLENRDRTVKS